MVDPYYCHHLLLYFQPVSSVPRHTREHPRINQYLWFTGATHNALYLVNHFNYLLYYIFFYFTKYKKILTNIFPYPISLSYLNSRFQGSSFFKRLYNRSQSAYIKPSATSKSRTFDCLIYLQPSVKVIMLSSILLHPCLAYLVSIYLIYLITVNSHFFL